MTSGTSNLRRIHAQIQLDVRCNQDALRDEFARTLADAPQLRIQSYSGRGLMSLCLQTYLTSALHDALH